MTVEPNSETELLGTLLYELRTALKELQWVAPGWPDIRCAVTLDRALVIYPALEQLAAAEDAVREEMRAIISRDR